MVFRVTLTCADLRLLNTSACHFQESKHIRSWYSPPYRHHDSQYLGNYHAIDHPPSAATPPGPNVNIHNPRSAAEASIPWIFGRRHRNVVNEKSRTPPYARILKPSHQILRRILFASSHNNTNELWPFSQLLNVSI